AEAGGGHDRGVERLEAARRARTGGAAMHRLPLRLDDGSTAQWTFLRHRERLRAGAMVAGRPDDLRDHVTGALHDHVVADTNVLAVDVLLVVQGRARDGHAADLDVLEPRPRAEPT